MSVDLVFKRALQPSTPAEQPLSHLDRTTSLWHYDLENNSASPERIAFDGSPSVLDFLTSALGCLPENHPEDVAAVKLLVPTVDMYVSRSDAIEMRMKDCVLVEQARSFVEPLQHIKAATHSIEVNDFAAICAGSIGGVQLRSYDPGETWLQLGNLEEQFVNRLSYGWLSSRPLARKRLAFIQGRADAEGSIEMWRSAKALGIALVVFDAQGHWLQDPKWSDLREAFVPMDITPDQELPARIVQAVRSYGKPFHGIMTVSDARLSAAARAAQQMSFATNPADAYDIAGDKYLTRKLEPSASESFQCTDVGQAHDRLKNASLPSLRYPLIVKPCTGWGSECVTRVDDDDMLIEAVAKACSRHDNSAFASTGCVVEPYISGPEFDANFVLLNGDVLFFEIADDYPSRGDSRSTELAANCDFLETQVVSSAGLPVQEQAMIRDHIHASIIRQGFHSGVYHCEGRVRDSTVEFRLNPSTGHFDLTPRATKGTEKPSVYLVENNARPPGYMVANLTAVTYGVDYFALQMLFALGAEEQDRFRGLAMPFRDGAQYYSMVQYVSPTHSGVLVTEDPGKEMAARCPDLVHRDNIAVSWSPKRKGDRVYGPESKETAWLSRYVLTSRQSLDHLLELGDRIVREYKYELDTI